MSLNDLGIDDSLFEGTEEEFTGELPQQMSDLRITPPQPGRYKFVIPELDESIFSFVDTKEGRALKADFSGAFALLLHKHDGTIEQFRWNVTTATRTVQKKKIKGGNFRYLLNALKIPMEVISHDAFYNGLLKAAGKSFFADVVYSAYCNPKKSLAVYGSTDGEQTVGCGMSWRMTNFGDTRAIPVDSAGKLRLAFPCECGAALRAWPELQKFGER